MIMIEKVISSIYILEKRFLLLSLKYDNHKKRRHGHVGKLSCCPSPFKRQRLLSLPRQTNMPPFPSISACDLTGRESQTVAADLDGTLLISRSSFPYFLLLAIEAGSLLRGAALLLLSPIIYILYKLVSESVAIKLMILQASECAMSSLYYLHYKIHMLGKYYLHLQDEITNYKIRAYIL